MLAGFVLLSAAIGMVAVGATIVLAMPIWVTLAAYPAICSLSLLLCAALWTIRHGGAVQTDHRRRMPSHG